MRSCAVESVCTRTSRQVAERRRELARTAAVERLAAAARGVDRRLHARVDLAGGHDPRALRARDGAAERVVADVGDELLEWAGRVLGGSRACARAPAASRVRGCARDHSQLPRIRARVSSRARAVRPSVRADVCSGHVCRSATGNQRRASVLEILGVWLHLWTPPRDVVDPAGPVAQARALAPASPRWCSGVALAVMIPRINEGKERARRAGAPPSRRRPHAGQPRARHQAPAAAHRLAFAAAPTGRVRRPPR